MLASTAGLMPGWLWITIAGLLLTVGDIEFRFYFDNPKNVLFILGFLSYSVAAFMLALGYFNKPILIATVAYITLNVVTFALVSYFYFGDRYSPIQIIGILFGFGGFVILEMA